VGPAGGATVLTLQDAPGRPKKLIAREVGGGGTSGRRRRKKSANESQSFYLHTKNKLGGRTRQGGGGIEMPGGRDTSLRGLRGENKNKRVF